MAKNSADTIINLIAVIVAVTNDAPRVLIVDQDLSDASDVLSSDGDPLSGSGHFSLPNGPFEPRHHPSLESGLRSWVAAQTGLDLYYVEQLYTFGNRYRDPGEIKGGPRVVSIAYIALTHEDAVDKENAHWRDWYSFLPWEDWRSGRPAFMEEHIKPALAAWVREPQSQSRRKQRQERMHRPSERRGPVPFGTPLRPPALRERESHQAVARVHPSARVEPRGRRRRHAPSPFGRGMVAARQPGKGAAPRRKAHRPGVEMAADAGPVSLRWSRRG